MNKVKSEVQELISSVPTPLIIAISQIGIKEIPGEESNSQINKYLSTVDLPSDDEIPWCSAFVNWCLVEAGRQGTATPTARSFLHWGTPTFEPKTGDIVVLKRGTGHWQGHVGFFLDYHYAYIYLLGGNQSNSVCISLYKRKDILSYREV